MRFFSVNDTNKRVVDQAIGIIREMAGERDTLLQETTVIVHDMTPESDAMVDDVLAALVKQGLPTTILHDVVKYILGDDHAFMITMRNDGGTVTRIPVIIIKIFVDPAENGSVTFSMRVLISDLLAIFERYGMIAPLGKKHDKVLVDIHERLKKMLVTTGVFASIK
jgi:hypothetical protein